jgi:hypothetical protein
MEGNFLAETLPPPLTPKGLIGRSLQSAGCLPLHLNLYRTILYPIFYLLYPIIHLNPKDHPQPSALFSKKFNIREHRKMAILGPQFRLPRLGGRIHQGIC